MEQHGTTMSSSYNFIIQIPRDSFFSIFLGSPVLLWAPQQSFVPVKPYSSSHSSRYRQISMPRPKENAPAPVQFLWRPMFSCLLYVPQNNQQTWRYDWYSFYRFQFRHPKNGRIFSPEFATRSVLCFSPGSTCRSSSWGAGSFVPAQVEPQSSSGRWGSSLRRSRAMRPCCVERSCFWWWNGYGSIPINTYFYTIFSGLFTSINPSFWVCLKIRHQIHWIPLAGYHFPDEKMAGCCLIFRHFPYKMVVFRMSSIFIQDDSEWFIGPENIRGTNLQKINS